MVYPLGSGRVPKRNDFTRYSYYPFLRGADVSWYCYPNIRQLDGSYEVAYREDVLPNMMSSLTPTTAGTMY